MIGFYNYTVILTYLGFLSSVLGIFAAFAGYPSVAAVCLLVSGIADMFDGPIARRKKDRTKEECRFGIQIDSLSDLVCFGVLPAVIGYSVGLNSWYWIAVLSLYSLSALIRLAYFNVTEEMRQDQTSETRKTYAGLPVTTAAYVFPLLCSLKSVLGTAFLYVYGGFIAFCAVLFVVPIKVKKPGKNARRAVAVLGVAIVIFLAVTIKRKSGF